MKRIIVILCILPMAGGIAWTILTPSSSAGSQAQEAQAPRLVHVQRGALRVIVEATGRVVPNQEVEIKCKASGEVIRLPADVSDAVRKGDLLVQLDPEEEKRKVKRAEVVLAVSQARLAQAKLSLTMAEGELVTERMRATAGLKSAETKAGEAQAKLRRVEQLRERQAASGEEVDIAQTAHMQAVAALEDARARVEDLKTRKVQIDSKRQDIEIAEAEVESCKTALADARQSLADTTVLAPMDAVVAERSVQVGQIIASGINNVGGGTTALKLADLSRIFVLVSVDESDIGRIAVGQSAQIAVDAYPDVSFPGRVVRVAAKGTTTSNVVTFEVKVEVTGPKHGLLKPEMTANVQIVAVEKENVLLVPVTALQRQVGKRFVTVQKKDGTREQRIVETGASDGDVVEILSGLSDGETFTVPETGARGRWQQDGNKTADKARQDRMKMRMMAGGR